ncbi:nucleoside hydrolase [Streptomyces mobaraensis]|uniref:nucleoside hydrolase n=1 Tax=Streptomyces mobaraensis TaxID=35621 RepID=UPI0033261C98
MVPSGATGKRISVVIDTDPGVDDTWAILYLAGLPDVEIVAIGAGHGNVPTAQAAQNALRVLDVAGLPHVPVAAGHPAPLQQPLATAEFVHGPDGLGGKGGPVPSRGLAAESSAEQLVRLAWQRPGELTVLALKPLTDIALALRMEPQLPRLIRKLVYMGGAFRVPGNFTAWADANTGHDPEAGEEVFRAGFDMVVVPMDVTERDAWASREWLDEVAAVDTPAARYATQILDDYVGLYTQLQGRTGCVLHDPLAAAVMCDETLATYEERQVVVELAGHSRGATLIDDRQGYPPEASSIPDGRRAVKIAVSVEAEEAMGRVRALLAGQAVGQGAVETLA